MEKKLFKVYYSLTVYENDVACEGQSGVLTTYAEGKKEAKEKIKNYIIKQYKKREKIDLKITMVQSIKPNVK